MAETIPDIDAWNARLDPPLWINPDSNDSTEAEPGDCGCCAMPKCCPPELECQSLRFTAEKLGHINPGDSDDLSDSTATDGKQTRWKKMTDRITYSPLATETSDVYYVYGSSGTVTGPSYDATSASGSMLEDFVTEYVNMIEKQVYGTADCFYEGISIDTYCNGGGTLTKTTKTGTNFSGSNHVWTTSTWEIVATDVGGEVNPDYAVWEGEFADYQTAHPEFTGTTYAEVYASWEAAYNEWLAMEEPDPETFPDAPTSASPENYPDCWFKSIHTTHLYEIDPGETEFTTREQEGSPIEQTFYGDSPDVIDFVSSVATTSYSEPMTHEAFIAAVNEWIDGYVWPEDSGSDSGCIPAGNCSASSEWRLDFTEIVKQAFRYRWKLNKCCGLYSALSWLLVFYPKEFIEWLATEESTSDLAPADHLPETTVQVWTWTGATRSEECDNSDSTDSVIGPDDSGFDPFDDTTRWSPWSLVVKTPEGQEGATMIRNLYMTCYRSIYGTKPDFIPLYGRYDSNDLDGDGAAP